MNDLISRSALIKVLKARATNEAIMGYMTAYDVTNSIIGEVEEQPTAYSVDEVVEELEENSSNFSKSYKVGNNTKYHKVYKAIKLNKAIEIVKAGKING